MITKDRKRTIPFLKLKVKQKNSPEKKTSEKKTERNVKEIYWKLGRVIKTTWKRRENKKHEIGMRIAILVTTVFSIRLEIGTSSNYFVKSYSLSESSNNSSRIFPFLNSHDSS